MPGIEDVLERLITDPGFRTQLATDPRAALADYELSSDDLTRLANTLSNDEEGQSAVEQRESKAGFFALFSEAVGGAGPATGTGVDPGEDRGLSING